MEPDFVFIFICHLFLAVFLLDKFLTRGYIAVPNYLLIFGAFVIYTTLTGIFVSRYYAEMGTIKYFYSNRFLGAFVILLLIENTEFSPVLLKKATYFLLAMLGIGAIFSIIQINDPLFFNQLRDNFGSNMSGERFKATISSVDQTQRTLDVIFLQEGRNPSIYSWIHPLSVGFDSIAIFSVLWGLKIWTKTSRFLLLVSGALVAFLTSTRWIMLNFFVASFQSVLASKNRVWNVIKYTFLAIALASITLYLASFFGFDVQKFIKNRLLSNTASTRLYAFEIFFEVFPKRPIWGTGGVDTKDMLSMLRGITSQIHVGWLKLFYYYGIVGGLIFLIFLSSLLLRLRRMAIHTGYWGGFFAFFAFAVANCTLVEFSIFYHGLLLAVIFSKSTDFLVKPVEEELPLEHSSPLHIVGKETKVEPSLAESEVFQNKTQQIM